MTTLHTQSGSGAIQDRRLWRDCSFIDGDWRPGENNARFEVHDPATCESIASVVKATPLQAEYAADAAERAFLPWAARLPANRSAILRRWHLLIHEAKDDLANIITAEQGKPISEARGEVDYGASFIEYFAEEAQRTDVMGITSHLDSADVRVWREPVGPSALVTPWNFPIAMITRKAAAALAVGCTVVVHPSSETPLSALALAELARRAGFPAGVFNVVVGDPAIIVGSWGSNSRVRAMSFTGSTRIGRRIYEQSAQTIKRLSLELGGHAPFIVFADADLDHAVDDAIAAKFATSGQDCLAANRFLIERPVYESFCQLFVDRTKKLTVGAGKHDRDIGPLINAAAIAKQAEQVSDAVSKGARVLCGGDVHKSGPLFFSPTVLADVSEKARIFSEETFGPIAAISPFDTEDEVVKLSNSTEYGLVAYLQSGDPSRILRLTRKLEFGMIAVNRIKITGPLIPFGGRKQSGLGREGSRHGIDAFSDIKYVCQNWSKHGG